MPLFDAHCHLQDERLAPRLDAALARARTAGIAAWVCCGTAEADWEAVRALAAREPGVLPSFGLHPWYVAPRSPGWFAGLRTALAATPAAVGEIGLDFALADADAAAQEEVFLAQYELSRELVLPASLHCRRAFGRLLELLQARGPHPAGFVLHSYGGPAELVAPLAAFGAHFSFSGALTRPHARRARAALAAVPPERLLLETDAPDLPPTLPERVELNEPANLVHVLRAAATILGASEASLAARTWDNGQRLYAKVLR